MSQIAFTVFAKAEPQGSKKAFVVPGKGGANPRAVVVDDNKPTLRSYRQEITRAAIFVLNQAGLSRPMAGSQVAVELTLEFTFLKPASSKKRIWPAVKPDIDKLTRSTFDALKGLLFMDDSQVCRMTVEKVYGPQEQVHVSARIMKEASLF